LQNKRWNFRWLFANVLMSVGKKGAGKKNKFWGGCVVFHLLLCLVISFYVLRL
jgi:hypothetical protein